jgi:ribosomal protein L37AE/L43A
MISRSVALHMKIDKWTSSRIINQSKDKAKNSKTHAITKVQEDSVLCNEYGRGVKEKYKSRLWDCKKDGQYLQRGMFESSIRLFRSGQAGLPLRVAECTCSSNRMIANDGNGMSHAKQSEVRHLSSLSSLCLDHLKTGFI